MLSNAKVIEFIGSKEFKAYQSCAKDKAKIVEQFAKTEEMRQISVDMRGAKDLKASVARMAELVKTMKPMTKTDIKQLMTHCGDEYATVLAIKSQMEIEALQQMMKMLKLGGGNARSDAYGAIQAQNRAMSANAAGRQANADKVREEARAASQQAVRNAISEAQKKEAEQQAARNAARSGGGAQRKRARAPASSTRRMISSSA